jgi:hypothetical protein
MTVYDFEICADPAEARVREERYRLSRKLSKAKYLRDISVPALHDEMQARVDRIQTALDAVQVSIDKYDAKGPMKLGRPGLGEFRREG